MLNIAHGQVIAGGAFITYALTVWMGVPLYLSFFLSMGITFLLAMAVERVFLRRLIGEPIISVIMVTIGLMSILDGVIYLTPHLKAMVLEPVPEEPAARRTLEREFNAARLAMCELTGRQDLMLTEGSWVPAARMAEIRDGWMQWLDTEEGAAVRLEALAEIKEITVIDPRWQLRYVLVDVIRPSPASVALASYRVLRDLVQGLGEKAAADPWWKTFPLVPDAELDAMPLTKLRDRVKGWWSALKR